MKNAKTAKNKNTAVKGKTNKNTVKKGPGRPLAVINWPTGEFTRQEVFDKNPHLAELTVIKAMDRDMYTASGRKNPKATISIVVGKLGKPANAKGLGRKPFVFRRKAVAASKPVVAPVVEVAPTPAPVAETTIDIGTPDVTPIAETAPVTAEAAPVAETAAVAEVAAVA
jgi:hypothetical protein